MNTAILIALLFAAYLMELRFEIFPFVVFSGLLLLFYRPKPIFFAVSFLILLLVDSARIIPLGISSLIVFSVYLLFSLLLRSTFEKDFRYGVFFSLISALIYGIYFSYSFLGILTVSVFVIVITRYFDRRKNYDESLSFYRLWR